MQNSFPECEIDFWVPDRKKTWQQRLRFCFWLTWALPTLALVLVPLCLLLHPFVLAHECLVLKTDRIRFDFDKKQISNLNTWLTLLDDVLWLVMLLLTRPFVPFRAWCIGKSFLVIFSDPNNVVHTVRCGSTNKDTLS